MELVEEVHMEYMVREVIIAATMERDPIEVKQEVGAHTVIQLLQEASSTRPGFAAWVDLEEVDQDQEILEVQVEAM